MLDGEVKCLQGMQAIVTLSSLHTISAGTCYKLDRQKSKCCLDASDQFSRSPLRKFHEANVQRVHLKCVNS